MLKIALAFGGTRERARRWLLVLWAGLHVLTIALALDWASGRRSERWLLVFCMGEVWVVADGHVPLAWRLRLPLAGWTALPGTAYSLLLFASCMLGEVWAQAFSAMAAGHVQLAGDFGCRWLAGLAAGQSGAGYRLLVVIECFCVNTSCSSKYSISSLSIKTTISARSDTWTLCSSLHFPKYNYASTSSLIPILGVVIVYDIYHLHPIRSWTLCSFLHLPTYGCANTSSSSQIPVPWLSMGRIISSQARIVW